MELRAMKALVEVVREGGFSRAARKLHLTQSTISKAVKQLEDEMNLPLLDRTGHKNRLTEAGRLVYEKALVILAQGEDLQTELHELRGLKTGVLRLGLPPMGSNTLFGRWFAIYRQRFPGVNILLVERGSRHLEKLVASGELDLAASLLPVNNQFDWQEVRREPICALLPVSHSLANRREIRLKELAHENFLFYDPLFAINPIILKACRQSGFEPKIVAESSQVDFLIELVAAEMGVTLAPRMVAEQRAHPLVRRIPVIHPGIVWHMAMIWRRGAYLSQAAQAWLTLADELSPNQKHPASNGVGKIK